MGLHKPFDRHFILIEGAIKTTGGSLQVAKGEFGIFNVDETSVNGANAVSSFKGRAKNTKYEMRLGKTDLPVTRSQNNKSFSSFPFKVSDVLDLQVSAPNVTEQSVDEVIIGWNGIDDTTAFDFKTGERYKITVQLEGEFIGLLGYERNYVKIPIYMDADFCTPYNVECEACDPCADVEELPIVLDAIERLKTHFLKGQVPVSDFIEVTPIRECVTPGATVTEIPYDFYCLDVCDTGDEIALSLVQSQFSDYKVIRTDRKGATSSYQLLAPNSDGAPADYSQTLASIIKGCEDCPAGYTEAEGGLIYAVTLEDEGVDESATVETLANAVAASAIKADAQNGGVGYYTVVLTAELSLADFNTFIAANPTATVDFVGSVESICENSTTTDTAWTACGSCNIIEQTYSLDLPDNVCGDNRLQEVRDAFPSLGVYIGDGTGTITATLTGASGTADVNVLGVDYLATFNTDLTITADDFVTTHAVALLAAGVTVSAALGVLTFVGAWDLLEGTVVTVLNVSGDLAGTATAFVFNAIVTGGCQTRYSTTVNSNLVCDECDDIFKDYFTSLAPGTYDGRMWILTSATSEGTNCKVGIRLKGKILEVHPDECLRDDLGFMDSSVQIRISGGYLTEVRANDEQVDDPFHTEYFSKWVRRSHLGGNLWNTEDRNRVFFTGEARHQDDIVARMFKGEESHLEVNKQYVDYALTMSRNTYSQSFSGTSNDDITYHIYAEVGRHEEVEDLLNSLAAQAGISPVQAFGK